MFIGSLEKTDIFKNMLIGIDGNEANCKNRVGVNVYAYELVRNLAKLQDEWREKHKIIVYLKDLPLPDLPKETDSFKYMVIPGKKLWVLTKLTPNLFFRKPKPDIFFSPSHYVPPISFIPLVCSIMDLGYLEFSGQFTKKDFWQLKLWSAYSINISKAIIAISEATKKDIVRHYPSSSKKVFVTHLAYDKVRFNLKIPASDVRRIKVRYGLGQNYILFLGMLRPSKNIEGLIAAYASISTEFKNIKLVIAGKKGWMYESIFKKVEDLGLRGRVIFTDYVPEEDKPGLIAGAKVFVLPSFWEGFGLDVLNAMACGVPVVISKVGSLPEVGEDAATYADPKNVETIAEGIKKVLSMDKKEYNKVVRKGIIQADKFSWEKTCRETLKILEQVKYYAVL